MNWHWHFDFFTVFFAFFLFLVTFSPYIVLAIGIVWQGIVRFRKHKNTKVADIIFFAGLAMTVRELILRTIEASIK